jgi:uncharacterized protein (TIGR00369 family)
MSDVERLHQEVLDRGEHLFEQLHMRDMPSSPGRLTIEMDVRPELSNTRGALQGGLVAVLIDVVAGRLALDNVPPGHGTATADMNVHFLAAINDGPAWAEARIIRMGRRSAVLQVEVFDLGADRLAATSTITFAILAPR